MSLSQRPRGHLKHRVNLSAAAPYRSTQAGPARLTRQARTLVIFLLLLAFQVALREIPQPVWAAEQHQRTEDVGLQGPVDFNSCVRLALRQSPFFVKSSLEIDVRRMDESDSRFSILPTFTFRTYYYVNKPENLGSRSYVLQFGSDAYNPIESYFTLQARKLITQMAVYSHMTVISGGLQRLGLFYLELDTLKRLAAYQEDLIELARQKLLYAENRVSIGTGTPLDVKVAHQEQELAQAEKESLTASRKKALDRLGAFLGLKPGQQITPDLRDVRRQILGEFDPAGASLEQVRAYSYELKIHDLKKQLQAFNVTLAKAKMLPTVLLGASTPDPLSSNAQGIYFSMGLEMPVWDGLKRYRNISRQKAILKQFGAEKDEKEFDLSGKWLEVQEELRSTTSAVKLAQTQEELARLKERQCEIRYQSGSDPLPVYLDGRKATLETRKNAALKALDQEKAILGLRHLTGELDKNYVSKVSW